MNDKVEARESSLTSEKKLMTYVEAAEFLRKSKSWLEKKVHAKEIPHLKLGSSVRFEVDQVTKWLKKFRSRNVS